MLAVIRVRFPNTPVSKVWSDAAIQSWMDPNIPFSLAHFWSRTSFFQADMRYFLFPAITINDPRADTSLDDTGSADMNTIVRNRLVRAVLNEVTRQFDPDWDLFDQYIIWFAQTTDMFGGGSFKLPTRPGSDRTTITGAVCDISRTFSTICQEVGHGFRLDHELGYFGNDYGDPYSSMSTDNFPTSLFERPIVPSLPVGDIPAAGITSVTTNDVQRVIGPYITPVQFYVNNFGAFVHPGSVIQVPATYETTPVSFRLTALDKAIAVWPARKKVLAVLPPIITDGDTYFLELRRNRDYDQGLPTNKAALWPVAIVIHAMDSSNRRIRFVDKIPLIGGLGDLDYHSFKGFFTVRLTSYEEDFSSVGLTVGGGDFWKHFGVSFEQPMTNKVSLSVSEWKSTTEVAPCSLFSNTPFQYRLHFDSTQIILVATSFGYEKPSYQFFINDQYIDPANVEITLSIPVQDPEPSKLQNLKNASVLVRFNIIQNRLTLLVEEKYSGIYVSVKVVVNESSSEVIRNLYEEQSVWTGISFDNVTIEWEQAYWDAQGVCLRDKLQGTLNKPPKTIKIIPLEDPRFQFEHKQIDYLLRHLMKTNPEVADVVLTEVSKLTNLSN